MTSEELLRKEDFDTPQGRVSIVTYQHISQFICNMKQNNYAYVVLDEAHFFAADALFNNRTEYIYKEIITSFSCAVRIYMTATSDEVLLPIASEEASYDNNLGLEFVGNQSSMEFKSTDTRMSVYRFSSGFEGYNWIFFKDLDDIVEGIRNDATNDKWMVFVSQKQQGKYLSKRLKARNGDSPFIDKSKVKYLDADNREDEQSTWEELTTRSKFSCKVLISTSVLDNGISIKDDNVRHIVLTTIDKVSLFQMIGRKRRTPEEMINVYVLDITKNRLNSLIYSSNSFHAAIEEYKKSNESSNFIEKYWNGRLAGDPDIRKIFYMDKDRRLVLNKFADVKLQSQRALLSNLKNDMDDDVPDAFPRIVLKWVQSENEDIVWKGQDVREKAKQDLKDYIFSYIEEYGFKELESTENADIKSFSEKEFEIFFEKCMEIFKNIVPKSRWEKDYGIRNEVIRKKADMNNLLSKVLKIPYEIEKESNSFHFVESPLKSEC